MKINRNIWLKYIQVYEDFNKEIPIELKNIFSGIQDIIGYKNDSFVVKIDLNDLDFCDIILNINVKFTKLENNKKYSDKDIIYYSNININDLIKNEKDIELPIFISDIELNNDKLFSVISHEVRHIYDVFTINEESDMNSFINSLYYNVLKIDETDENFKEFLDFVYLSLEHELIARNTMIYENFINCKCDKDVLLKLFENTYMYKSLLMLKNFNCNNILKSKNIIDKTNKFISYFGGDDCENEEDVKLFYIKWQEYFNIKSNEYLIEANKMLDDVYNVIKENKIQHNIKNVIDILKDIYANYIK